MRQLLLLGAVRWAFRLAYLGRPFHGSQRQPGLRTVEGDLLAALEAAGVLEGPREARFQVASRTDRGVSAVGNVVAFDADQDGRAIVAAANPRLEGIWLTAWAAVPRDFRPRHAHERWYRYHFRPGPDVARMREGTRLLEGVRDFGPLCKGSTGGRCHIRRAEVREEGPWTVLDIRADRFLWNLVRRLAFLLRAFGEGRIGTEDLEGILAGDPGNLGVRPAPAERLWLMEVRYDEELVPFRDPRAAGGLRRRAATTRLDAALLEVLAEAFSD